MENASDNKIMNGGLERPYILKVILSVAGIMFGIEFASLAYIIYILGLYRGGRWAPLLVWEGVSAVFIVAVLVYFCLKWARGVIAFGTLIVYQKEPTTLEAEECVKSIYTFARNGGLLFTFAYFFFTNVTSVILYKWHDYTLAEAFFHSLLRCFIGLNLGVVYYYAVKIIEQYRLDQATKILFGAGVYQWEHHRLKIGYKIFMVIFTVAAYLLCSAIIMGFSQTENAQRIKLQEDLEYRVQNGNLQAVMLDNNISATSRMLVLSPDGSFKKGDETDLSPDVIKQIISSESPETIADFRLRKLIVYAPRSDAGVIMVGIGYWGMSKGVQAMTRNVILILLGVSLFFSVIATFLLVKDINTPLSRLLVFIRSISRGGTESVLTAYSEDELGDFASELARTTALLETKTARANELLDNIRLASVAIEKSVAKVQEAANEQAMSVNEQASAVEEALSASNEIVATARQIAESALDVQTAAEKNMESCRAGDERVSEALKGFLTLGAYIEEVSQSVVMLGADINKMSGVMAIIEEIATQINLLALNAQIEAAGAGEAGARFMVVAEEVQRLAESTMDALKRISALVNSTLKAAENAVESAAEGAGHAQKGAGMADAVGSTFKEILAQVDATEKASRQISIITTQQKTASEQTAETISGVHASAYQIKRGADNVLKAMNELSETAEKLAQSFGAN